MNQFTPVLQSRQQALRAFCLNIYCFNHIAVLLWLWALIRKRWPPLSTNQICILYFKIYCHVIHSIIFIRYFENLVLCMSCLKSLLAYFAHKLSSKSLENEYSKYKIQYSNHIFDSSHSITYMLYSFILVHTHLVAMGVKTFLKSLLNTYDTSLFWRSLLIIS